MSTLLIISTILIATVIAALDLVNGKKTRGTKILWLLIVLLVPGTGALLYLLLGRRSA